MSVEKLLGYAETFGDLIPKPSSTFKVAGFRNQFSNCLFGLSVIDWAYMVIYSGS